MFGIFKQLLDLIYKKRCYFCKKSYENTKMCSKCYGRIKFLLFSVMKNIDGVPVYCAAIYKNEIQKMIRGVKYHNQKELAYYQAKIMFDYWQNIAVSSGDFVVVPVPLHKSRQKQRGYNHMVLVAKEFAKLCGYEVLEAVIERVKETKPQYRLTQVEREQNLKDAFKFNREVCELISDKNILILDDILTTGATLSEIIKTFKQGGIDREKLFAFTTSCSEHNIV